MRSFLVASLIFLSCVDAPSVDGGQGGGTATDAGQGGGSGGGGGTIEEADCGGGYGGGGAFAHAGVFPGRIAWNQTNVFASSRSPAIISALQRLGGWGSADRLQVEFSLAVLRADSSTPLQSVSASSAGYCDGGPDCDAVPLLVPLPANGNTEGSADYACQTASSACRVLVWGGPDGKLYELSKATSSGSAFTAQGVFVWQLGKPWGFQLRGDQCFSADESGLPIAALLPTADEVASGGVPHGLRFVLPGARMKAGVFVRPATHSGSASSTEPDAPPMGVRFRLKTSFDETPFSPNARVILRALKTYGMFLSGSGEAALSFADDRLSTAKWSALDIDANTFETLRVTDFEVAGLCGEIPLTSDCVRTP